MDSLYFKVKKFELNGETYTGVVLPYFEQNGWSWSNITLRTEVVKFITINGENLKLIPTNAEFKSEVSKLTSLDKMSLGAKNVELKNTRITDKKLKELIEQVITLAKEEYKMKLKMIELNKEGEKLLKSSEKKNDKISGKISEVIKSQGLLTENEFQSILNPYIKTPYSIAYTVSNSKITEISLEKEHDLGTWIKEGQYSFLYIEYDDNVCVCDNYENNKQLQAIKSKYFKKLTTKKVCGYNVLENFYPSGGGDKRSASVHQEFIINLKNGIELKKENISKIIEIFKELFANLK